MNALTDEGWHYVIGHFEDSGFIHFEDAGGCVFAYHSHNDWEAVLNFINQQWGRLRVWDQVRLLAMTKMKSGKTNYVFEIF